MPPKPDSASGLILLPSMLPKGKEQETLPISIPDFRMPAEEFDKIKGTFKFGDFERGHSRHMIERVYDGLYAGERKGLGASGSGFLGIKYEFNTGIPKTLDEILKTKTADCDELTRAAFYFAQQNRVNGLEIAEMTWIDQKTGKLDGHAVLVIQPDESTKFPLLFDLTYLRRGEQLEFESMDVSLRKKYAEEAKNPDFKIRYLKTIEEVEASHYDYVGWGYSKNKNWAATVAAYEKAVALVPIDFQMNRNLAFAYKKNKEYEKALAQFKKVIGIKDGEKDAEVHANIGFMSRKCGKTNEAITALEKALELQRNEELNEKIRKELTFIYIDKGNAALDNKNPVDALGFFKKARFYSPEDKRVENEINKLEKRLRRQ